MYYSFLLICIVIPTKNVLSFSAFLALLDVCKALNYQVSYSSNYQRETRIRKTKTPGRCKNIQRELLRSDSVFLLDLNRSVRLSVKPLVLLVPALSFFTFRLRLLGE